MEPQNNQNSLQPKGSEQGVLMGILSYLGPLVVIPFLVSKDEPFVKFHIKQGLVVLVIEILAWILGSMAFSFWIILNLVNLATLVLSVIGIVNVVQKKEKELPLVGGFSKYFTF